MASSHPNPDAPILAFDTGSPTVGVAVGRGGHVLAERSVEIRRSSEHLLGLAQECLEEAGLGLADLGGLVALAGPGSFTGLRVGLATALGLHQALGLPAAALPTLPALAACAMLRGQAPEDGPIVAVVDALRCEWFAQRFQGRFRGELSPEGLPVLEAQGEPEIVSPDRVLDLAGPDGALVGFGLGDAFEGATRLDLGEGAASDAATPVAAALALTARELGNPEAPGFLRWAADTPDALTRPLYLRKPAVSKPKRHRAPGL